MAFSPAMPANTPVYGRVCPFSRASSHHLIIQIVMYVHVPTLIGDNSMAH
jgi:hypothetical protein